MPLNQNAKRAEKCTKLKIAGTEEMRQMARDARGANSPSPLIKLLNNPRPPLHPSQKTKIAALRFRGKVDARAYTMKDASNRFEQDFMTECNEQPTQDWQRRWNVAMILRHNGRHQHDQKPLLEWITESPDNYAMLKRPLPESKSDRIYVYDIDDGCNPWDEPTIYNARTLSFLPFKIQVPNLQKHPETIPEIPSPLSPILENQN